MTFGPPRRGHPRSGRALRRGPPRARRVVAEGDRRAGRPRPAPRPGGAHLHARHRRRCSRRPTPPGARSRSATGSPSRPTAASGCPGMWATDPDRCCFLRKVEPLERALADADCWISGVRRDQSPDRAEHRGARLGRAPRPVEGEPARDAGPSATSGPTSRAHDLPYNPLHDQGYASIGCTHCTLPGAGREGRWAGLEKTECGIHAPARG